MVSFYASQSIQLAVADQQLSVQAYLSKPERLVQALVEKSHVEHIATNRFRLRMRPFSFMMLTIQPIVDLKVSHFNSGRLELHSNECEIIGNTYVNQRFSLDLEGHLLAIPQGNSTLLSGTANLCVTVDLPPPLNLAPKALIETTGNGLLKGILLSIKQRLSQQLLADYYRWINSVEKRPSALAGSFSPRTSF